MRSEGDSLGLHVALLEPEIHWNTGNAGRTCLAVGACLHLVEPLGFSLEDRQVRRAGLDYWHQVQPTVWPSWAEFDKQIWALGSPYYFSPGGEHSLWDVDLDQPVVLVFGAETRGLPEAILEQNRDRTVHLPQCPQTVRSLNLSTCVGVALFEALRQRR